MEREEYQIVSAQLREEYDRLQNDSLYVSDNCTVRECRLANDEIVYFSLLGLEGKMADDAYSQLLSALYYMGIPLVFHIKLSDGKVNFYIGAERHQIPFVKRLIKQQLSVNLREELLASDSIYNRSYDCGQVIVGDCSELSEDTEYGVWDRIMRFSSVGMNASVVVVLSPLEEMVVKRYLDIFSEDKTVLERITSRQITIRDERETISFNSSDAILLRYKEVIEEYVEKYADGMKEGMFNCAIKVYTNAQWENDLICGTYLAVLKNESLPRGFRKINVGKRIGYNDYALVALQDFKLNGKTLKLPLLSNFHTTREAAQIISLPRTDVAGFYRNQMPEFDMNRDADQGLYIGDIISGNCKIMDYIVPYEDLNRHIFVPGMTGSGKTNTIKGILRRLYELGVPWLVIEPAKAEYYEMYQLGVNELSILTAGSTESGFHINPFEPINKDVPLQEHVDSLYAALMASFTWTAPMPYVMENAIYRLYEEFGFDFYDKSRNEGLAYPTIEALYWIIPNVVEEMNYEGKMKADVISSVQARISTLRKGTKGSILNVQSSSNWEIVFQSNSIVELEQIKDNDTKAFIMSLVCILLREYRMQQKDSQQKVKHFMLIEEAHRLLKNCGSTGNEEANPRASGVEFFSDMLAELRSKGQGFIMADQIPEQLTPGVMRNTNLKIVHRLVSGADSRLLGETMRCTEDQISYMSVLKRGQAVVFSEGDYRPKLVRMPYVNKFLRYDCRDMTKDEIGQRCKLDGNSRQDCLYNESPYVSLALIKGTPPMPLEGVSGLEDKILSAACDEEFEDCCMDVLIYLKENFLGEERLEEAFWLVMRRVSERLHMDLNEAYAWILKTKKVLKELRSE